MSPLLCTVMACNLPGGTLGQWLTAQWVAAVVLLLFGILALWADVSFRHRDE